MPLLPDNIYCKECGNYIMDPSIEEMESGLCVNCWGIE